MLEDNKGIVPMNKMGSLPTEWEDKLAEAASVQSKAERPTAGTLSFRSGILTYQGDAVPDGYLDVIILSAAYENTYYGDREYDPDAPRNPCCFALGSVEENLAPHELSEEPEGDSCTGCPQRKWGSRKGKSRGKACQERRRLALIPGNVLETDDGVLAAEVATAKLPVTSVRHWKKYLDTLSALYQRPSYAVVTRISCTPDPKTQFKVNFEVVGGVDAERLAAISSKIELVEPTLLKPYEPAGEEEEEAPETKAAKKKRAKKLD